MENLGGVGLFSGFHIHHPHKVFRLLRFGLIKGNLLEADAVTEESTLIRDHYIRNGERMSPMEWVTFRIEPPVDIFRVGFLDLCIEHFIVDAGIDIFIQVERFPGIRPHEFDIVRIPIHVDLIDFDSQFTFLSSSFRQIPLPGFPIRRVFPQPTPAEIPP